MLSNSAFRTIELKFPETTIFCPSPETILSIDERKQTPKDLAVTELNDTTVQLIEERMEEKHVRLKITLINKKLFV